VDLKRTIGLAAAVFVAFALVATAGAARGLQGSHHRQFHFKTPAAVLKYLRAQGVNVRGVVVQRGLHNYAGPNCPGKRWNCTKARRVIQFATTATASNSFVCSPTSAQQVGTASPNDCVIVQVAPTSGDNNAKCVEQSSVASVTQNCSITQTNVGGGANNAVVIQLITQGGQTPGGKQNAHVTQQSETGSNNSALAQTILQTSYTGSSSVSQSQDGRQTNSIDQTSTAGGSQLSAMSQIVVQKATAGSNSGFTPFASASFTGSQTQFGDGQSDTNQSSTGVSKSFNFQNMLQTESAPRFSTVTQDQKGPFRCCSLQGTNAADVFNIQQSKTQFASSAAASQFEDENGFLDTSGHGHISQFANQNGTTQSNTCDVSDGECAGEIIGEEGTFATCTQSGSEVGCSLCPPITGCPDFAPARSATEAVNASLKGLADRTPVRVHHFG
jgi:hypothetical protein